MNFSVPLRLALATALSVLVLFTAGALPASAVAYAAPSGLKVGSHSASTVDLTWNSVKSAPRYRIQMATNASMGGATYFRVTPTNRQMTGLKANTKYYFKVRVITADGGNLSSYSAAVSATTNKAVVSSGFSYGAPGGLKSTAQTPTSTSLAWNAVKNAPRYRIQMATNSAMSAATYFRVTPTNRVMTGLTAGKTYFFKVRVITADGGNLSSYSSAISVKIAATPPPEDFPLPSPAGLESTEQASTMLSLAWDPVAGAPEYRIQLSTSASMSAATYFRFTGTSGQIPGLAAGTKYYLKVRVITADGVNQSLYSDAVVATTKASTEPALASPLGFSATKTTTSAIDVSWSPVAGATNYQVQASDTSDMSSPTTILVAGTKATVPDLSADTTYYLRVRAATSAGAARGNLTTPLSAKTATSATPKPLKIASYNVRCANCLTAGGSRPAAELPWTGRRAAVVSTIIGQMPDVLGAQEASQGWLRDSSGKQIDLSQFEDLRNRLDATGSNYKLTNSARNNCVKSTTPTKCVYKDQGASQDNKIFYNADTIELVNAGSKKLASACSGCNDRYVAWATLRQKATGKEFFFATTHLEPTTTYDKQRETQVKQAVAEITLRNPKKLPIISVGDFNSTRYNMPTNFPYEAMVDLGLVDPLGQTYRSPKVSTKATAEKRVNANYNSFNGFNPGQTFYAPNENGNNLDYIFTSPMRVTEWETVVKLDAVGRLAGVIPSDHNMIRATVLLP